MRKLAVALLAVTAIGIGSSATAASWHGATLPGVVRNFTPIHEAACRGWGPWCPPGYVRRCGPFRCWCRPCW